MLSAIAFGPLTSLIGEPEAEVAGRAVQRTAWKIQGSLDQPPAIYLARGADLTDTVPDKIFGGYRSKTQQS